MQITRLKKEHFDKKSKLEEFIDFYDCTVCFMLSESIMECPLCRSHVCQGCLLDYSKAEHAKNPNLKAEGSYKCVICHKIAKHIPMHKFLYNLLQELKFKCNDCHRVMQLKKLKGHKDRGECHKDLASEDREDSEIVSAVY
jgi:hypothetical protein